MKQEVTDCAPWFEDVRIADALLKTPEDYQKRTAEALWESVAAEAGSSPVIFWVMEVSMRRMRLRASGMCLHR